MRVSPEGNVNGRVPFLLQGQNIEAGPGEVVHIPSSVWHGAEILDEEAEVLEVFSPIRPDFLDKAGSE